jgi:hypothetical protein
MLVSTTVIRRRATSISTTGSAHDTWLMQSGRITRNKAISAPGACWLVNTHETRESRRRKTLKVPSHRSVNGRLAKLNPQGVPAIRD